MDPKNTISILIKLMNFTMYAVLIAAAAFAVYSYKSGLFSSVETFRQFVMGFGIWAPLIFLLIQTIQVIIPVLPGAVSCAAGVLIFGVWMGLVYNYIGVCIGSTVVFLLSKKYGQPFVKRVIGEKAYGKYIGRVNRGRAFDNFFAAAIFFPAAPDDLLCYMAGLTEMPLRRFLTIILLAKPFTVSLYSLGMAAVGQYLMALFRG